MQNTNLLIEVPADTWALFHDDKTIAKYRLVLGQLVAARFLCCKSDLKEINDRIAVIHRQIRGRQIRLLKASKAVVHQPAQIDFSILTINR